MPSSRQPGSPDAGAPPAITNPDAPTSDTLRPAQREVFISYSRADLAFAERLDSALCAAGRSTWIDRRGIEPTEEWLAAIYAGIDQSDNFLLIVTPRSVASLWCRKEVDSAADRNKRLIPILAEPTDPTLLPPQMAARQWIDLTEDFTAGLAELLTALDRDLAYVREHTRLLGRALDWKSGRGGLLARGELEPAERWLSTARREPAPTPLQTELIVFSRGAATRTQRRIILAATIAVVVALGLAAVAFWQRNEARRQTARATENLADTRAAQALADVKPRAGLRHAVAALDTAVTPPTRDALLRLLQRTDNLRFILDPSDHSYGSTVQGLAFDPAGTSLAAAQYGGQVQIFDMRTGATWMSAASTVGFDTPLAVSGDLVAGAGIDGLTVWRGGAAVEPFFSLEAQADDIRSVALAGKERVVAALPDSLRLCDLTTRACIAAQESGVEHVTFAGPGGHWLVTAGSNHLTVRDGRTLRPLGRVSTEAQVATMAGNSSSAAVSLALTDHKICLLDATSSALNCVGSPEGPEGSNTIKGIFGLTRTDDSLMALSGDGRLLAVTDFEAGAGYLDIDMSVTVWEAYGARKALAPLRTEITGQIAAVSVDGSRVVLRDRSGRVTLTDSVTKRAVGKPFQPAAEVADCSRALVAAIGEDLVVHDGATGAVAWRAPLPAGRNAASATFSADGTLLAVERDGHVRFYAAPSGKPTGKELSIGERSFVFVPGRRTILTFDTMSLDERDIDSGAVRQRPLRPGEQPGWDNDDGELQILAVSPDGRRIVTCAGGLGEGMLPRIVLWDLARGTVIASQAVADYVSNIKTLAFGTDLIAGSDASTLHLFDAATLQPIGGPIDLGKQLAGTFEDSCDTRIVEDPERVGVFCDAGAVLFSVDPRDWRQLAVRRAAPRH